MAPIHYNSLESAIERLAEGFVEADAHPELLTTRDGVIQRFEIAMDLAWKLLHRTLQARFDVDERDVLSKKDIFRHAARCGLIDDVERWIGHYEARNRTSHVYDADEAARTYERARTFLVDAAHSLQRMKNAD
jgi:nucleotidyltransferase substrate binding protein (TIGR01987 family)